MKSSPRLATNLVQDIYSKLDGNAKISPERVQVLGARIAESIAEALNNGTKAPELRMSNFGTACERQLWYKINKPELAEPLEPEARFKFLYGHIAEELALFLAEEVGRDVRGRQKEVELHGIKGHIDAIIDGVLFDIKSTSARQFDKFASHRLEYDDPFSYKSQLEMYMEALKDDPDLAVKGEYAFLAVHKEHGDMVVDRYRTKKDTDWKKEVDAKKEMLAQAQPPERAYEAVPDGKSGNLQLPTPCKYCPHKRTCWPSLRVFKYSNGPRYLTKVSRQPEVEEIT